MAVRESAPKTLSFLDRHPELKKIPPDRFPHHLFIIPDGNARWARKHGWHTWKGHERGKQVLIDMFNNVYELREHVRIVGGWGRSVNNSLKRSREEVGFLNSIFEATIEEFLPEAQKKGIRIVHLGNKDIVRDLSPKLHNLIVEAEEVTKNNTEQIVVPAIDFGAMDQDKRIAQKIVQMVLRGELTDPAQANENLIVSLRDGGSLIPPADLVIRTAGELRFSGLGWLIGDGTQLYSVNNFFPDFDEDNLVESLKYFSRVERRFGGRPEPDRGNSNLISR